MEKNQPITLNKMETMPMGRLLLSISMPMIISMMVQALYNIVDSMFVARISEEALSAVSLVFPIQNLMISVAVGTAVGLNALISRYLGEKNLEKAHKVAQQGLFLTLINGVIFVLIGVFFSEIFFSMQTSNEEIIRLGKEYMSVITIASFGLFFQVTFERYLQSTGRTHLSMIVQIVGAGLNIVLDPILIFGLFGCPELGVMGAAIATVIGQTVAAIVGWILCVKKNKEISLDLKGFRPSKFIIGNIYRIGFPVIIMQSIGSVMIFGINAILIGFSVTATAVFGIYFRLQSFIFLPVFGMTNGLVSVVAYNYGARNKSRILAAIKITAIAAVAIMVVGMVVFLIFPKELLRIFDANSEMLEIGIVALRVISVGFPIAGFCISLSGAFQALGFSVYSLILSIVRQLVAILPIAFALSLIWGVDGVWLAFPASEVICLVLNIILLRRMYDKVLKNLEGKS